MSLTTQEKTDIRRLCGYPPLASFLLGGASSGLNPVQYRIQLNDFESRLGLLSESEEASVRATLVAVLQVEDTMLAMKDSVDVASVAVYKRNPFEMQERIELIRYFVGKLLIQLGAVAGPGAVVVSNMFGVAVRI